MIPQWRVPKYRENLPSPQSSTASIPQTRQSALLADAFRSQIPLSGSSAKNTNRIWDASVVTVHWSWRTKFRENLPLAYSMKKTRSFTSRMLPSGETV
jgi:hypothetical protein